METKAVAIKVMVKNRIQHLKDVRESGTLDSWDMMGAGVRLAESKRILKEIEELGV